MLLTAIEPLTESALVFQRKPVVSAGKVMFVNVPLKLPAVKSLKVSPAASAFGPKLVSKRVPPMMIAELAVTKSLVVIPAFLLISKRLMPPGNRTRFLIVSFPMALAPGENVPPAILVTLSAIVPAPPSVAPADTVTGLPDASDPFTSKVPALTLTGFEKVFAAERRRVPDPALVNTAPAASPLGEVRSTEEMSRSIPDGVVPAATVKVVLP